ncbi:hypothetical protein Sjap_018738 [Stephania japonica]|uniref:PUM-HD domain-containing protein n=1 Tax=Stephania japonica TaxID=461633 RepID=A0AAP0NKV8_9MAGN
MKDVEELLGEIQHGSSVNLQHHQRLLNHHRYVCVNNADGVFDSRSLLQTSNGGNDMHDNDQFSYYKSVCVSPVSGFSLNSEGSLSSSHSGHSGGLCLPDEGSPTSPLISDANYLMYPGNSYYVGGFPIESQPPNCSLRTNVFGNMRDELGLCRSMYGLRISDERVDSAANRQLPIYSHGVQVIDCLGKTNGVGVGVGVGNNGEVEDCVKSNSDYGRSQGFAPASSLGLDDVKRSALLRLQQESQVANLSGSHLYGPGQFHPLGSSLRQHMGKIDETMQQTDFLKTSEEALSKVKFQIDGNLVRESPLFGSTRLPVRNAYHCSEQIGNGLIGGSVSPCVPQHYSFVAANETAEANPNAWIQRPVSSIRNVHDLEAFNCEDSLIIQEKGLSYILKKRSNGSKQHICDETGQANGLLNSYGGQIQKGCCPFLLPLKYNSLSEVQGYIYVIAKDQHGCRFLQRKFDEGNAEDMRIIFDGIINHVVELMMNPFGNYLIQKVLDVCTEEQRMAILLMVASPIGQLVEISLNSYGTRAVQRLIDTVKTRQQISLVVSALEPGFLKLIKDLNGNHVIQRCLQCLSNEDNKFIFNAAARYCVDIATHRHGCCVLQRCIGHSTGEQRKILVTEISANGLLLAQNAYGNYVIQYILELKIPFVTEKLTSQFRGNYVHLSVQKFSSNVIQKCLKVFDQENQSEIIHELLSAPRFELILQDPFANYVIQTALSVSKGPLHAALVEAIRPLAANLRTSPYCKKIFSRTLLRK